MCLLLSSCSSELSRDEAARLISSEFPVEIESPYKLTFYEAVFIPIPNSEEPFFPIDFFSQFAAHRSFVNLFNAGLIKGINTDKGPITKDHIIFHGAFTPKAYWPVETILNNYSLHTWKFHFNDDVKKYLVSKEDCYNSSLNYNWHYKNYSDRHLFNKQPMSMKAIRCKINVIMGTLEFKEITGVFMDESGMTAEITYDIGFNATPFGTALKHGKYQNGEIINGKVTAKKFDDGWRLEVN